MTAPYQEYLTIMDQLREARRRFIGDVIGHRPFLDKLADLYEKLTEDEQGRVEAQGWRVWPEQYDARKRPHLIDGEFQSDKYPQTPRGKVPLSVKDTSAQDLLWEYAQRHRVKDSEFSDDLEEALKIAGYVHQGSRA